MNGRDHIPVLREEVLHHLPTEGKGIYVDCTIGLGGHAQAILECNPEAEIIGFDLDEESLVRARERLAAFADRVELFHSDFRYLPDLNVDHARIKGVLLDLGISSFQLDTPRRGFSYQQEGPLDMRMDLRGRITAARVVNKYSERKLADILFEFGELRQARRLAKAIVTQRKGRKIETTTQLFKIVEEVCRWRPQKGKTHPAARVFQAIRIEVNQELAGLDAFLERTVHRMPPRARLVAISFHSLEDRIIKHTFSRLATAPETRPAVKILTKKPILASEAEIALNSRSRSAKMRAAEKL